MDFHGWSNGEFGTIYYYGARGMLAVSTVAITAAVGFNAIGYSPWLGKIANHPAHHTFPLLGPSRHLQFMLRTGLHHTSHLRIPFQFIGLRGAELWPFLGRKHAEATTP